MQKALLIIIEELERFGLILSLPKTETMAINVDPSEQTSESLISYEGFNLKNTTNFKYLGLMTSIDNENKFLEHRIATALSKFNSLKQVLYDHRIEMKTRLRYLNSFVRSRLTYSAATWQLNATQVSKLEVIWMRLLRKMVNRGFKRKPDQSMLYTNNDILRITGSNKLENYIRKQQLRWVGHVCRMENSSFQKRLLFAENKKYKHDLWIQLEKISGFDRSQLRKLMMNRNEFFSWLNEKFN